MGIRSIKQTKSAWRYCLYTNKQNRWSNDANNFMVRDLVFMCAGHLKIWTHNLCSVPKQKQKSQTKNLSCYLSKTNWQRELLNCKPLNLLKRSLERWGESISFCQVLARNLSFQTGNWLNRFPIRIFPENAWNDKLNW